MWARYLAFCEECDLPSLPVTYRSVSVFLIDVTNNRNASTKSLSGTISQLRVSAGPSQWLSYEDELKLRYLVNQLKALDFSDSNAVSALQFHMLAEAFTIMDLSNNNQLLASTIMAVGNNCLFRNAETSSGILASHVSWRSNGRDASVAIKLLRTKTHLTGPGCIVEVSKFDSPFCCYSLLKKWWLLNGFDSRPDDFIFPSIQRGIINFDKPMSGDNIRKIIKLAVSSIGLNPKHFSGHSLRAGGATDLFEARVPYHIIKKMGRWKSDAAMRYYRSEDDVVKAVRKAFNKMCKKIYKSPS